MAAERADRWSTVPVRRRVLGVVRTLTALDRLHDVFGVLADDFRVEVRFAVAEGSEFSDRLAEHLHAAGMTVVDWQDATKEHFDLAISPSSNGALHELDVPLLTLPHGAGYHKLRPTDSGVAGAISGLAPEQLLHNGRVVASVLALSHDDQLDLLRRSCPQAAERAAVVGDPCFDRLRASVPMRAHYRSAMSGGKLVVVSSTWGGESLFARQPDLAARLVAQLPGDHRVALVLHPNIWSRHGAWQIDRWTRGAQRAGLIVVPPHRGWRAALVASDVVLADHGSLALYAAALGKPLLLAEFGAAEVAAGTPAADLGTRAQFLGPGDLRSQVDGAIPLPEHASFAARTFAAPGGSTARLRAVIYDQLGLPEPDYPARPEPVEVFAGS